MGVKNKYGLILWFWHVCMHQIYKRFIYHNRNLQKSNTYGSCCKWAAFHSWSNSEPAVLTVLGRRGTRWWWWGKGLQTLAFVSFQPQPPGLGQLPLLALDRELKMPGHRDFCFFTGAAAVLIWPSLPLLFQSFSKGSKVFPSCSHTQCDRSSGGSKPAFPSFS